MTTWSVEVDRVRVLGAQARGVQAAELRGLIAQAVEQSLGASPLPSGRAGRASVRVNGAALDGGTQIAKAVAGAVQQAIGVRAHG